MTERLTEAQKAHLQRIAKGGSGDLPHAGWFNTTPERNLEKRGMIRHWTEVRPLGGGGPLALMSVSWRFAELTEAGRKALEDHHG